jgi:uncharacterized ferritin-like protein (DUF455 family)
MNMNENNIWDEDNSWYLFEAVEPVRDAVLCYIRLVRKFKKQSVSGLEMVSVKARVNGIMGARDSY